MQRYRYNAITLMVPTSARGYSRCDYCLLKWDTQKTDSPNRVNQSWSPTTGLKGGVAVYNMVQTGQGKMLGDAVLRGIRLNFSLVKGGVSS
jgi:hypothetical protein